MTSIDEVLPVGSTSCSGLMKIPWDHSLLPIDDVITMQGALWGLYLFSHGVNFSVEDTMIRELYRP